MKFLNNEKGFLHDAIIGLCNAPFRPSFYNMTQLRRQIAARKLGGEWGRISTDWEAAQSFLIDANNDSVSMDRIKCLIGHVNYSEEELEKEKVLILEKYPIENNITAGLASICFNARIDHRLKTLFPKIVEVVRDCDKTIMDALFLGDLTATAISSRTGKQNDVHKELWATENTAEFIGHESISYDAGIYALSSAFRIDNKIPNPRQIVEGMLYFSKSNADKFLDSLELFPQIAANDIATTVQGYTTPYIQLMLKAIETHGISEENQSRVDVLRDWFMQQEINGVRVTVNEAEKLASFIRNPVSKRGVHANGRKKTKKLGSTQKTNS